MYKEVSGIILSFVFRYFYQTIVNVSRRILITLKTIENDIRKEHILDNCENKRVLTVNIFHQRVETDFSNSV